MRGFESLILGEKTAVVFDFGIAYTKCGFAGETNPRLIFPTKITMTPSVLFAPSHLVTIFTLGIPTAIVLDSGFTETQVIPIFEGYTLLNAWQSGPLGSKTIHENLRKLLVDKAKIIIDTDEQSCSNEMISEQVIEDIKASRAKEWKLFGESNDSQHSKPKLYEERFAYPLDIKGNNNLLQVPFEIRELAVECLFTGDNDLITLASLILRGIVLSPIDVRRALAENIVLIGGTVIIPGLAHRLIEELNSTLEFPEFTKLSALKDTFKLHKTLGSPNHVAWLGGAIFGALESLPGRSLNRTTYLETGVVPDWSTNIDKGIKDLKLIETR